MDDMVNHHGFPLQDAPVKDGRTSKEFLLAGIQKDLGWGGDWCGWCHMKKGINIIQYQWSFHIGFCLRIGHHFCYKTAINDGGPFRDEARGTLHQNKKDKRIREDMLWQRSKSFQWHVGQSVCAIAEQGAKIHESLATVGLQTEALGNTVCPVRLQ